MTDMTAVTRTTEWMRTADGIRLDADVYRPPGDGPWPVLLMRQPYGRAIASTVVYAHPRWYAARGFMVVIQDVRGRGTSEGEFRLLENERADGAETVAWAAGLPGSNGAVGMYGFSYQGMTQLLAAADRPPALRAIAPAMAAWDVHADFATQGGAFRLQASYSWGMQLAMETARRAGDADAHAAMASAMAAGSGWPDTDARGIGPASRDVVSSGVIASAPEVIEPGAATPIEVRFAVAGSSGAMPSRRLNHGR